MYQHQPIFSTQMLFYIYENGESLQLPDSFVCLRFCLRYTYVSKYPNRLITCRVKIKLHRHTQTIDLDCAKEKNIHLETFNIHFLKTKFKKYNADNYGKKKSTWPRLHV